MRIPGGAAQAEGTARAKSQRQDHAGHIRQLPKACLRLRGWSRVREEMSGRNTGQGGGGSPAGHGVGPGLDSSMWGASAGWRGGWGVM